MPSPAVALSVNKKKNACAAAIASFENELQIVKAAANAVLQADSKFLVLSANWAEPMLTVWTYFQNLLEPDVRVSAGSQEINNVVAASLGNWVNSPDYIRSKDQSVRGKCKAIVAAFYRAMCDMSTEQPSFCLAVDEDEPDFFPRALWHKFWNALEPNVRYAAYEVHEKYLKDFVSESSKCNPDLEPFSQPDEDTPFPDEIIAKLSGNSNSAIGAPIAKPAPVPAIDYTTSPYDDDEEDSKYIKVVMPDNIDRAANARHGCLNAKALPPVVLLIPRGEMTSDAASGGASVLAGSKRSAEAEAPEAAPVKRMSKKPIQALPASELDLNTTARVAFYAMNNLDNRGRFEAVESDHRYGILGEFWDEFLKQLPNDIHTRINLARGDARAFFHENY